MDDKNVIFKVHCSLNHLNRVYSEYDGVRAMVINIIIVHKTSVRQTKTKSIVFAVCSIFAHFCFV